MKKIKTVLFLITLCFSISSPLTADAKKSLPAIELPDYVISGVERAAKISGERIKVTLTPPDVILGKPISPERPHLESRASDLLPGRPVFTSPKGGDYWGIETHAGNFAAFGIGGEWDSHYSDLGYAFRGHFENSPRLLHPGQKNTWGAQANSVYARFGETLLSFSGSIGGRSYELQPLPQQSDRTWNNYGFSAGMTPIYTRLGKYIILYDFQSWRFIGLWSFGDVVGYRSRLSGNYSIPISNNLLNFKFNWDTQEVNMWALSSSLLENEAAYSLLLKPYLFLKFGFISYWSSLNSYSSNGIGPTFSLEWKPSQISGVFNVQYSSEVDLITLKSLIERYPEIYETGYLCHNCVENSIIHKSSIFKTSYRRDISNHYSFGIEYRYQRERKPPVLVPMGYINPITDKYPVFGFQLVSQKTNSVNAHLTYFVKSNLRVKLFGQYSNAKVDYGGKTYDSPMILPMILGSSAIYRLHQWSLGGYLSWYQKSEYAVSYDEQRPAFIQSNLLVGYQLKPDITLSMNLSNLFNSRHSETSLPGYDAVPFSVMLKLTYGKVINIDNISDLLIN